MSPRTENTTKTVVIQEGQFRATVIDGQRVSITDGQKNGWGRMLFRHKKDAKDFFKVAEALKKELEK